MLLVVWLFQLAKNRIGLNEYRSCRKHFGIKTTLTSSNLNCILFHGLCSVRRKWSEFIILIWSHESQEWRPGIRSSCHFGRGLLAPWTLYGPGSLKKEHFKTWNLVCAGHDDDFVHPTKNSISTRNKDFSYFQALYLTLPE